MRIKITALTVLLVSAVCSASAAPVLYSFSSTGNGDPSLSFQYLSPSYITSSSPLLTPASLSNLSLNSSYLLSNVTLTQTTLPTYTRVDVQTTLLETFDFNQPIVLDYILSNGPTGNIYLDRDGTYTLTSSSGRLTLSVTATPEPSTAAFLLLTAPVAWFWQRKRRRMQS